MERTTDDLARDMGKMLDNIIANVTMIQDTLVDICKQSKPEKPSEEKAIADYHAYGKTKQNEAELGGK